jgi:RNA polymerase sigma-70 factor (ECF subfamily)
MERLFREYKEMVYRVCYRYTGNGDEAQDLMQDVFIKIHRHRDSYRGDSQLRTWVYRIAINRSLDYLRTRSRRQDLDIGTLDPVVLANLGVDEESRSLARVELERIMARLRPRVRKILFLTMAEGLSYAETAEVLDMTKSAVAKTVSRFLARRPGRTAPVGTDEAGGGGDTEI